MSDKEESAYIIDDKDFESRLHYWEMLEKSQFPIITIDVYSDGDELELGAIYKNHSFWLAEYAFYTVLGKQKKNLMQEAITDYTEDKESEVQVCIDGIHFYHIDILRKVSEEMHSNKGLNVYHDIIEREIHPELKDLYDFLWDFYGYSETDDFSKIVLSAYNIISTEINTYDEFLREWGKESYINNIYEAKYCISTLDFVRIVVFGFISRTYAKFQSTPTLYKETRSRLNEEIGTAVSSGEIPGRMGTLTNFYKTRKNEYDEAFDVFNLPLTFEKYNQSGEGESSKKYLLKHEYLFHKYSRQERFNDFFLLARKIKNGTITDNHHYLNSKFDDAIRSLQDLYNEILSEDMAVIDKCMLFDELEARYKIEYFYKWLKYMKKYKHMKDKKTLLMLANFYAFWIDKTYQCMWMPYYNFKRDSQGYANFSNAVYYFCDTACEYYAKHIDELERYFDFIIAFNAIYQATQIQLENRFDKKMKEFDFINNVHLNKFLKEFTGKGQHILFNKDPYEEINIADFRCIYGKIFSENE